MLYEKILSYCKTITKGEIKDFSLKLLAMIGTLAIVTYSIRDILFDSFGSHGAIVVTIPLFAVALFAMITIVYMGDNVRKWKKYSLLSVVFSVLLCIAVLNPFLFVAVNLVILYLMSFSFLIVVGVKNIIKLINIFMYFGNILFIVIIFFSLNKLILGNNLLLENEYFFLAILIHLISALVMLFLIIMSIFVPIFVLDFINNKNKKWGRFIITIVLIALAVILSSNHLNEKNKKRKDPCYQMIIGKGSSWYQKENQICVRINDHMQTLMGADIESFKQYSGGFLGDKNHVYYDGKIIPEADPETFQSIEPEPSKIDEYPYIIYFKDETHVFFAGKVIQGANVDTFIALNNKYGKTSDSVYCGGDMLENSDSKTFELVNQIHARDKNQVYYGCKYFNADPATFHAINNSEFYADKNKIFFYGNSLKSVDVENFRVLDRGRCATDGKHYFNGDEIIEKSCDTSL